MLQVFFFYLVTWWFTQLESKKALTVRAVLAGIFSLLSVVFFISMIVLYISIDELVALIAVFVFLIMAILFFIRSICDIAKIRNVSANTVEKKPQKPMNDHPHSLL